MPPVVSTRPTPIAKFWQALSARPYDFDLFFALRYLQAQHPELPLFGRAGRPQDEPVRLGQDPSLAFAPATIAHVQPATAKRSTPRVVVWNFGLYGPNGPMPRHITEYVYERLRHSGDATLARFSDLFHHRLLMLFFRAWSDAQPSTSLDRPGTDPFGRYLSSIAGLGLPSMRERDAWPDHAKLAVAGHLSRCTRNPEGLRQMLQSFFEMPVQLHECVLHHLDLAPEQQIRLSHQPFNSCLGLDAVVGARVLDAQSKFRLVFGPLSWSRYQQLLPGTPGFAALVDGVRNYLGIELAWDYELVLSPEETPELQLGNSGRLGWSAWLASPKSCRLTSYPLEIGLARDPSSKGMPLSGSSAQTQAKDAQNFTLDPERWLQTRGLRHCPLSTSWERDCHSAN